MLLLLPGHQKVRARALADLFALVALLVANAPHIVRPSALDSSSSFTHKTMFILHVAVTENNKSSSLCHESNALF